MSFAKLSGANFVELELRERERENMVMISWSKFLYGVFVYLPSYTHFSAFVIFFFCFVVVFCWVVLNAHTCLSWQKNIQNDKILETYFRFQFGMRMKRIHDILIKIWTQSELFRIEHYLVALNVCDDNRKHLSDKLKRPHSFEYSFVYEISAYLIRIKHIKHFNSEIDQKSICWQFTCAKPMWTTGWTFF